MWGKSWGKSLQLPETACVETMTTHTTRTLHRLTATGIKHLSQPGWHNDGGGLYLEVDSSGAKRWAMRLTINGKRRDFGLGPLHKVSLQQARIKAAEYREKAFLGNDPIAGKRRTARTSHSGVTFAMAAEEAHRARRDLWTNGKHVDQWLNTLRDHAFALIGDKPVDAVTTADVLAVLSPIWASKPETARRLRQRIRAVLEWARAAGLRSGDNPVDLIGQALPRHTQRVEHHQALPYHEVAAFLQCLREGLAHDVTKAAFEFLILTAARTQEVRLATWSEIDLHAKTWSLPPERMKARREHVVPLSPRALAILNNRRLATSSPADFVFPDPGSGKPLSENRFLNARDAIGYTGRCTPHGFRSSFRDWAAEETAFPPEVAEMALAHTIKNKAEAAYRRGDLLAKRRLLMEAWERYLGLA